MIDAQLNIIEDYIDSIREESSTRKKQLSYLNDMIHRIDDNTYKVTLMKITVSELYAQYEGFFKFIFNETINYIKIIENNNVKVNNKFMIFSLLTHLTSEITNQKTKAEKMLTLFSETLTNDRILDNANFNEYIINLDSTKHTMSIFGIDSKQMPMRDLDLLYKRRCEIAHGNISEDNPFYIAPEVDITNYIADETYKYWEAHYKSVIYAIDKMSELFINYIENKGYLAA